MSLTERFYFTLSRLWISGVRLRCPNCTRGLMFSGLFTINKTCSVCGVQFERLDGESIGGTAITLFAVPSAALAGFFLIDLLTPVPFIWNALIWGMFIIVGCTLLYRHSRAAWVAVSYVTGGVYADAPEPDTTAEREQLIDAIKATRPPTPEAPGDTHD
jgi:uncharacterized protein (DUF983 family)